MAATLAFGASPGCGSNDPNYLVKPFDSGADGDGADPDAGPDLDPTLGGPCNEDAQCNDKIDCTYDKCDQTLSRCRNTPDDTQCDDGIYCQGKRKCVLRTGCVAGAVVTCQDDDLCTIDKCVESTKSCTHELRDVDGDSDPDGHCAGGHDCDDTDPTVNSKKAEICANGKDDNCNGQVDEEPCSKPANDTCADPLAITAKGTYFMTTVAASRDYLTCPVNNAAASKDVVAMITPPGAPADPKVDVEVWATSEIDGNEVSVELRQTCTDAATKIECEQFDGVSSARAIVRNATPGTAYYAIVTAQLEATIDVHVDIRPAAGVPTNEDCGAPLAVPIDSPFVVSIIDAAKDPGVASACAAKTGELSYSFTIPGPDPKDVKIFASTVAGSGTPVVSLRDATCTTELRCRVGSTPPAFARALAPGTYFFTIAGTTQLDASVLVKTYPATTRPTDQDCATAPAIAANGSVAVNLADHEDAIADIDGNGTLETMNECLPGGPAAAYDLELAVPSDVLVIARFPLTETGAIALYGPTCAKGTMIACAPGGQTGGVTPQRISKRNLAAGSYRLVIADTQAQSAKLDVLVRPTVAPTLVGAGSDNCLSAMAIPATGGFFTGDTSTVNADFDAGCDAPGQPIGGAKDQIMKLDLLAKQRVVLDMSGSVYTTLLDVRQGLTCPGIEVPDACYVGGSANRSFLDIPLGPGTFWVQIDGYSGDRGAWNLDVRVLP
jgi:hypothetical protein